MSEDFIGAKYDSFGLENPDKGINLFEIKKAKATINKQKDEKGREVERGYRFGASSVQVNGASEGAWHHETFFTRTTQGEYNKRGLAQLLGLLVKAGVVESNTQFKAADLESGEFIGSFENKLVGKLYAADINIIKGRDGKERSVSNSYLTSAEYRAKKDGGVAVGAAAAEKQEDYF